MLRDKSNLAVGLFLPGALIVLFGYGLSFDVKNVPVAVVMEDSSPMTHEIFNGLQGTTYLSPVRAKSMAEAERRMSSGEVIAILQIPVNFSRQLISHEARVQLLINGVDSTTAASIESYVSGVIGSWVEHQTDRANNGTSTGARVEVVQRVWFNEAGNSTWYLVPGLIVLVLTLIGAFLTSMLIAREWESGTLESLFVTPVRPLEIVLAKLFPYLVIGAIDLVMCLLAARYLFHVPTRGSLGIIVFASMLYLTVSLLFGLFISGKTRNQFQASQMALLTSFMPAVMLSGFVFDPHNNPIVVQLISQLIPATHFMSLVKTLFLAGNIWPMILRECAILLLYVLVLIRATQSTLRKTLE